MLERDIWIEIIHNQSIQTINTEEECFTRYLNHTVPPDPFCPTIWDSFLCWPAISGGSTISMTCNSIFHPENLNTGNTSSEARAFRVCSDNGTWLWGNWTNYTECLDLLNSRAEDSLPEVIGYILLIGSAISLLTLSITFFVFTYFESLQCSRLRVHRHLVGALVMHSILLMVVAGIGILSKSSPFTENTDWLCKTMMFFKLYASMATINWMFVEGLLLHSRIATSVFRHEAPFKLYYIIGWVAPIFFLSIWTSLTCVTLDTLCWRGYGNSSLVWIITGPMILVLSVNAVFLVNIIRILLGKLRGNSSVEIAQVTKAVKATALLFPLLGMPHLLFCINPGDQSGFHGVYMVANALLQSSQGFFVSVLYCFMNSEVQGVLKSAYSRAVLRRNPNTSHRLYSRGRTLSRTSTTFLSTYDKSRVDTNLN